MRFRPALRYVLPAILFALAAASALRAQNVNVTDQVAPQLPGAGHNFLGTLNEAVNPANGSVGFRFNMPVPPGRKLTLPVGIAFTGGNQTAWQPQAPGGVTGTPAITPFSADGWSLVVPQLTRFTATFNSGQIYGDGSKTCDATTGYIFTDASGTQHTINMAQVYDYYLSGIPLTETGACQKSNYIRLLNYFPNADPMGGDPLYSGALLGAVPYPTNRPNNPDQDGAPTFADPSGTVYSFSNTGTVGEWCSIGALLPNGVWGYPQSITDRNANSVKVSYTCNAATNTFSVTDTLGRPALSASWVESPTNGSVSSVTVEGLSQPYKLNWSNVSWSGGYTLSSQPITSMEPFPNLCTQVRTLPNGAVGGGSEAQVTSINLPETGESYQIAYDPVYGQISQITYPSGGTITYTWGVNPLSAVVFFQSAQSTACASEYDTLAVVKRVVSYDGVHPALEQDFSYQTNWSSQYLGTWNSKVTVVTTHDLGPVNTSAEPPR